MAICGPQRSVSGHRSTAPCRFPASNAWNADISAQPIDPNSDALIASIGLDRGLHPDFGAGLYEGAAHRHSLRGRGGHPGARGHAVHRLRLGE
jgi:hypothetical protein